MAEEYLNKNAKSIIQPMVTAVFIEKPKDPVINYQYLTYIYFIDFIYDSMAPKLWRY